MSDTDRRIKQMCAFIISEAEERAVEMAKKTEMDVQIEVQNTVRALKQQLDEEYAAKIKQLQINDKVSLSTVFTDNRIKKMQARDGLLKGLQKETLDSLGDFSKGKLYPGLVTKLLVQGLMKLQEPIVEISCRPEDRDIVISAIPEAKRIYAAITRQDPAIAVSRVALDSKDIKGGFVMYADNGKISCNQTFNERLAIAYHDLLPKIRDKLGGFKI